jgi:hypothetical protein
LEAAPPQAQEVTQRIFTGSIGATVTAPYDYPWTWSTSTGSPQLSVSADKTTGRMSFDIWNNSNDASGSAAAALGIFFKPMTASGILRLSSNPAFSYYWWTICSFASAHSDAFIGLYVGRYTLGNSFDGALVNQEIVLWSDDSWWSGAGSHQGENSGYPLFAQFNVDSSNWYALWCGAVEVLPVRAGESSRAAERTRPCRLRCVTLPGNCSVAESLQSPQPDAS